MLTRNNFQTYLNNPAFLREYLSRNQLNDPESRTSGVMNAILNVYFPSSEGYVHRPEDYVVSGYVDINTHQWVPTPAGVTGTLLPPATSIPEIQVYFLVTQCKAARFEQHKPTWLEGRDQLDRYIGIMRERNAWNSPNYGIVAVGSLVRFYQWSTAKGYVEPWGGGSKVAYLRRCAYHS